MDTKRISKNRKIFIVGYSGSGTRILAEAMRRVGIDLGEVNEPLDYLPILTPMMDHLKDGKRLNKKKFKALMKPKAIKHPQLLFLTDVLKELFPDCVIIAIKRDKEVVIRNEFPTHKTYRKTVYFDGYDDLSELDQKRYVYDKMYENKCDHVIRFEDIIKNHELVNVLLEELGFNRINTDYII